MSNNNRVGLLLPSLLLLLTTLPTTIVVVTAQAEISEYSCSEWGCSEHGFCRVDTDECQCNLDYRGYACQVKIEVCPDADTTCYNNGKCIPYDEDEEDSSSTTNTVGGKQRYYCDCLKSNNIQLFEGDSCQIKAFTSCEVTRQQHDALHESFCVNGGTCTSTFDKNRFDEHSPCDCSTAQVEGLEVEKWDEFCNVVKAKPPQQQQPKRGGESDQDRQVVTAFIAVVIIIFVCSAIVFVVMGMKRAQKDQHDVVDSSAAVGAGQQQQQQHHAPTLADLEHSESGQFT